MVKKILTIAGSDPSGGAGIQADLKTFSALKTYGMAMMTALTAQSTQGVDGVFPIPVEFIEAQFTSIIKDIEIDSLKIGALAESEIVNTVAMLLEKHPQKFVVIDTVMIAKGGHSLLKNDAICSIRERLLPLASMITPNIPEAAALLQTTEATNEGEMEAQGRELLTLGCKSVLMKGGHLIGSESPDLLITPEGVQRFSSPRINTRNTHGTGCTLSAAIAALYPTLGINGAVNGAKIYINEALKAADNLKVGHGIGPTHHFHQWW